MTDSDRRILELAGVTDRYDSERLLQESVEGNSASNRAVLVEGIVKESEIEYYMTEQEYRTWQMWNEALAAGRLRGSGRLGSSDKGKIQRIVLAAADAAMESGLGSEEVYTTADTMLAKFGIDLNRDYPTYTSYANEAQDIEDKPDKLEERDAIVEKCEELHRAVIERRWAKGEVFGRARNPGGVTVAFPGVGFMPLKR